MDRSHFSPRMVARAIGVSESSLKRWCDQGKLHTTRTAGGHRRVSRAEVVRFLRDSNLEIANPEVIGLPKMDTRSFQSSPIVAENIKKALLSADEATVRQVILTMFVSGWRLHRIFDDVIANVFQSIGSMWECDSVEIYKERLSTEIAVNILRELRSLLPVPTKDAPRAIGASLAGDHYTMPSLMVEMVLRSLGWNALSLGQNLPLHTLAAAAKDLQPKIFWVSISHVADVEKLVPEFNEFAASLPTSTALAIGGYAITAEIKKRLNFTVCCDNIRQFEAYAENITEFSNPVIKQ